jgi:DNA-binding transcriptional MerR regulator
MHTRMTEVYTAREVIRAAGASHRQIQWWDEKNVIAPEHIGHRRLYHPLAALTVMIVARLRKKQLSLQAVRQILPAIRRTLQKFEAQVLDDNCTLFLLTNARSIGTQCFKTPPPRAIVVIGEALEIAGYATREDGPVSIIDLRHLKAVLDGRRGYERQMH